MMKRFMALILLFCGFASSVQAEIKTREFNGVIYVEETTVAELEELFEKYSSRRFSGQ